MKFLKIKRPPTEDEFQALLPSGTIESPQLVTFQGSKLNSKNFFLLARVGYKGSWFYPRLPSEIEETGDKVWPAKMRFQCAQRRKERKTRTCSAKLWLFTKKRNVFDDDFFNRENMKLGAIEHVGFHLETCVSEEIWKESVLKYAYFKAQLNRTKEEALKHAALIRSVEVELLLSDIARSEIFDPQTSKNIQSSSRDFEKKYKNGVFDEKTVNPPRQAPPKKIAKVKPKSPVQNKTASPIKCPVKILIPSPDLSSSEPSSPEHDLNETREVLELELVPTYSASESEASDEEYFSELVAKYESGTTKIAVASSDYYGSDLVDIKHNWGDSDDRIIWRTRQCLDYLFMWNIGLDYDYFLQLEDDLVIDRGFFQFLMMQIQQRKDDQDWISLEFSGMGFIGKLFRKSSLQEMAIYTRLFYRTKPIDVIYWDFVKMKACLSACEASCKSLVVKLAVPVHDRKFLHHVGRVSSLEGKISHLGDLNPTIEEEKIATNLNKKDVLEFYYGKKDLLIQASKEDTTMEFYFSHLQSP
ncbi:Oidioi.mRNA.OKI2018_I69.chr1.g1541.t1.cds [Oikopleura dioica]|uniref:Oidioi.mRNA.OKI2018_I69.chr1.g1541.t1.cds n=1 Tax=Oikopleura dioica TaxID=34765 RepID=A0ABN7SN90_OIKDI|nr:Oidioi.mRNA.OKI2018_I69.chr1.g1541.t1.cds [Oikopleura dioica]